MSVRITDNTNEIKINNTRNCAIALRYMLDGIDVTANPRTPKKLGNLRRDTNKSVVGLRGTIAWNKNYAGYQETKQYRNYTTPGTGPHYAYNAVKKVVGNSMAYLKKARVI